MIKSLFILLILQLAIKPSLACTYTVTPHALIEKTIIPHQDTAAKKPVLLRNATVHPGDGNTIDNAALAIDGETISLLGDARVMRLDLSHYEVIELYGTHVYPAQMVDRAALPTYQPAMAKRLAVTGVGNSVLVPQLLTKPILRNGSPATLVVMDTIMTETTTPHVLHAFVRGRKLANDTPSASDQTVDQSTFREVVEKHLNAVTHRDLTTLESTLSPAGKMQLILPGVEIIDSVSGFMEYHRAWFQDTTWTFETRVLNTEVGDRLGMAIVEVVYREPERDGKPYFNRMIVSYVLEKTDGRWYFIKDHASSVEKSTDKH